MSTVLRRTDGRTPGVRPGKLARTVAGSRGRSVLHGIVVTLMFATAAQAQQADPNRRSYSPLDEMTPPGVAGNWSVILGRSSPDYFQPVRILLPGDATVTLFDRSSGRPVDIAAPAQVGLIVGHTYRIRVSGMAEFPGIELYPTVEVLDRLHPPVGKQQEFPVPIELTNDEINLALEGNLITKVIYLERPQSSVPSRLVGPLPTQTVGSPVNLFAEANQRGRPMLILRLGGRLPDAFGNDPAFFGTGGPFSVSGN